MWKGDTDCDEVRGMFMALYVNYVRSVFFEVILLPYN